jgi:predicted transposase YbfD/YdcC
MKENFAHVKKQNATKNIAHVSLMELNVLNSVNAKIVLIVI